MKHPLIAFTLLVLLATVARGQNQLYVNQISTSGTTTIVQTGSSNTIGSNGTPSEITSENVTFESRQVGNSNLFNFSFLGNNLDVENVVTGNSNTQKMYMDGANNKIDVTLTGNSNTFILNKDSLINSTVKSTSISADIKFAVAGNSNIMKFGIEDGKFNTLDYTITGNSNDIHSLQIGNPAGIAAGTGHEQTVTITGSTNTLDIYQAGIEKQTAVINLTGSSNTIQVQQTTTAAVPNPGF